MKKWLLNNLLAPFLAALLTLLGNYYFFHKPEMEKEYTQMGVDIVLKENIPMHMKKYGYDLIGQNSPIKITDAEKQERLEQLLKNIPANLTPPATMTVGESFSQLLVYTRWAREVEQLCPECINTDIFNKEYERALAEVRAIKENKKQP